MKLDIQQIKKGFEFTKEDEERIKQLNQVFEKYADEFIERFYLFIFRFPQARDFLKNDEIISRHREKVRGWFLELFSGNYNIEYFLKLQKIGEVHVSVGLPTHYVNAAFNFIRRFIIEKIDLEISNKEERNLYVTSIGKLLDINLDILTIAYREEELSKYAALSTLEKKLFVFSKRFAEFIDVAILGALIIVSLFVIFLFAFDMYKLLFNFVPVEEGIITLLGGLLILWAVAELMNEEIKHFKGGGFGLSVFIGIALAAMIRKLLIASLSESSEKKAIDLISYSFVILVLGVVFYIINKEKNKV